MRPPPSVCIYSRTTTWFCTTSSSDLISTLSTRQTCQPTPAPRPTDLLLPWKRFPLSIRSHRLWMAALSNRRRPPGLLERPRGELHPEVEGFPSLTSALASRPGWSIWTRPRSRSRSGWIRAPSVSLRSPREMSELKDTRGEQTGVRRGLLRGRTGTWGGSGRFRTGVSTFYFRCTF